MAETIDQDRPDLAVWIRAWLAARSAARGLPAPVEDAGGYRVDVHAPDEVRRWVFPRVGPAVTALAQGLAQPRHFIKACAPPDQLLAALPPAWRIALPGYFMRGPGRAPQALPVPGYRCERRVEAGLSEVRILTEAGELAASGHAAETAGVFIYDRIITEPAHQRRGLGRLLMRELGACRIEARAPELLVATAAGRALYEALGWTVLSPFSTAFLPDLPAG
ncbi:GNAT family N-acetyltransferase [Roseateles flavus]|uniref:GNAT family N-acetyltransferase n=1 Tax=Roseateles flavus TaxID=3149041 RepID=A0ABV0GB81_9BURK